MAQTGLSTTVHYTYLLRNQLVRALCDPVSIHEWVAMPLPDACALAGRTGIFRPGRLGNRPMARVDARNIFSADTSSADFMSKFNSHVELVFSERKQLFEFECDPDDCTLEPGVFDAILASCGGIACECLLLQVGYDWVKCEKMWAYTVSLLRRGCVRRVVCRFGTPSTDNGHMPRGGWHEFAYGSALCAEELFVSWCKLGSALRASFIDSNPSAEQRPQ